MKACHRGIVWGNKTVLKISSCLNKIKENSVDTIHMCELENHLKWVIKNLKNIKINENF